eukprot:GILI01004233.1.p1 GENE.GILI01004233.1~~GILI01004233.1.p1  ORF type:complete len:468 (+),score=161.33 GILI01004233.1:89-1492(+)
MFSLSRRVLKTGFSRIPSDVSKTAVRSFSSSLSNENIMKMNPYQFTQKLVASGRRRFFVVCDKDTMHLSGSELTSMSEWLMNDKVDFKKHEGMFFEVGKESGALFGAFLWNTVRGQGAGGIRLWPYESMEDFVRDGMRLSLGMGRKSALAGLWWGGGKGIIARPPGDKYKDPAFRKVMFEEYGQFLTSLKGCYIGAEDVGTTVSDIDHVFSTTRFCTCISPALGGSGNPSVLTAEGVVCSMEGALDYLNMGNLKGKKIAMMGAGNVAFYMIEDLLQRGVGRIVVSDINAQQLEKVRSTFGTSSIETRHAAPTDLSILSEPCDILAPNALGGVINKDTIPTINAKIVCGAANNQLRDPASDDALLQAKGITFIPDYVCNRMGIVNCANEQYGSLQEDPAITRHFRADWDNAVFNVTKKVLEMSRDKNITTTKAANMLADSLAAVPHPIFPHRSMDIMRSLVKDKWHQQ